MESPETIRAGVFGVPPVIGNRQFVVREREQGVELYRPQEMRLCRDELEPIQRADAEEVRLIRIDPRGAERSELRIRRRRHPEDRTREWHKCGEQGILIGGELGDGAQPGTALHVEHVRDEARAPADLDEVAHHEIARASATRQGESIAERKCLRDTRGGEFAEQIGDSLVVHDGDVRPPAQVERQQVDARVAEPIEVRRLRHVGEGHDDPCPFVERGVLAPRASCRRRAPARWRCAVRALRVCDSERCRDTQCDEGPDERSARQRVHGAEKLRTRSRESQRQSDPPRSSGPPRALNR